MSALTTMLVGEGAKLDVHGCKTVDMASSFGKVCFPSQDGSPCALRRIEWLYSGCIVAVPSGLDGAMLRRQCLFAACPAAGSRVGIAAPDGGLRERVASR